MAGIIEIRLDTADSFKNDIIEYIHLIKSANISAAAHIRNGLESIIIDTYENALTQAGSGFHQIYADHLRQGIFRYLNPQVYATDTEIVAEVFDISTLGDYGDLEEGFHRYALENPLQPEGIKFSLAVNVVELPYTGQQLYNEDDPDARYDFWKSVVDGTPYEVQTKSKGGYTFTVPTEGYYEDTLLNRVEVWGDRYPEWLLLEYGTPYYPEISPTHISYFIQQNCFAYMEQIWQQEFDAIVDAWNSSRPLTYSEAALANDYLFEPRGRGSRLRDPKTGRFTKGG